MFDLDRMELDIFGILGWIIDNIVVVNSVVMVINILDIFFVSFLVFSVVF